jgi:hypothetical protein
MLPGAGRLSDHEETRPFVVAMVAAVLIIVSSLFGCAVFKEKTLGHTQYPAGNGALVDTNGSAVVVPSPINDNHR